MWSTPFASREGAGIAEILRITGCRTYTEFHELTDPVERRLIVRSIEAWHEERGGGGGGIAKDGPPAGL